MRHTIAIIGVGAVGSAIANAIISLNISADLILLDKDEERCAGHVQDLSDALGFSLTSRVFQGTYEDVKKAHIVIISAGRPQQPGESRLELIGTNKEILDDVLSQLVGLRQDALVIMVTNPLDILTYCALKQLDIPRKQIFGTGTYLDSQRLRHLLGNELGISERSIEAFVLGEHGDSQVIAWSSTKIAGNPVEQFGITLRRQRELAQRTKQIAYEIIHAKGASYFGISSAVAQLCEMILYNARQIVPISWYHEEYAVCMSLPVLLTEKGIEKTTHLALTKKEQEALERSAEMLRNYQKMV
jgi:L-lactate dehydrogenase